MILDTYAKPINLEGHEGLEYLYLCGTDFHSPVGDISLQCIKDVCFPHIRIYRPSKENIELLKECAVAILGIARDELKYALAAVSTEKEKPLRILKQAIEGKFEMHKFENVAAANGGDIYFITLDPNITREVLEGYKL